MWYLKRKSSLMIYGKWAGVFCTSADIINLIGLKKKHSLCMGYSFYNYLFLLYIFLNFFLFKTILKS